MRKEYKRIRILSAIVVVLSVAAFFALKEKSVTNTIKQETSSVAVADTAAITKIEYVYHNTVNFLNKKENAWYINDKYEARSRWMLTLLAGLKSLEIKRPVSADLKDKVYEELKQDGLHVTVYLPSGKQSFYLHTNDNDPNSTYLLQEGSQSPYVVYVPGISGDISTLFKFGENEWRSRRLFESSLGRLKSVKVSYVEDTSASFEIIYKQGGFYIPGISNLDTAKVVAYLQSYQYVPLFAYLSADSAKLRLTTEPLFAEISVEELREERNNAVKIFKSDRPEITAQIEKTGEYITLKPDALRPLFVKKSYFIKE